MMAKQLSILVVGEDILKTNGEVGYFILQPGLIFELLRKHEQNKDLTVAFFLSPRLDRPVLFLPITIVRMLTTFFRHQS